MDHYPALYKNRNLYQNIEGNDQQMTNNERTAMKIVSSFQIESRKVNNNILTHAYKAYLESQRRTRQSVEWVKLKPVYCNMQSVKLDKIKEHFTVSRP